MQNERSEYDYLWSGGDWVLVKSHCEDGLGPYSIYNKATSELLLVEDEDLFATLCSEMRRRGCEILNEIPMRDVSLDDLRIEN
jgi:hypothetical protein